MFAGMVYDWNMTDGTKSCGFHSAFSSTHHLNKVKAAHISAAPITVTGGLTQRQQHHSLYIVMDALLLHQGIVKGVTHIRKF